MRLKLLKPVGQVSTKQWFTVFSTELRKGVSLYLSINYFSVGNSLESLYKSLNCRKHFIVKSGLTARIMKELRVSLMLEWSLNYRVFNFRKYENVSTVCRRNILRNVKTFTGVLPLSKVELSNSHQDLYQNVLFRLFSKASLQS